MKILTIDDSMVMRRIISSAASMADMESLQAKDAKSALKVLEEHADEISLILLDWNMPEINGLELLKMIKANPAWKDIPVMMVTSESGQKNIADAIKAGASNYLTKPFAQEDLVSKIMQCLGMGF